MRVLVTGAAGEQRSDSLWGYIDVYDLARAYRLAVESELTCGEIFWNKVEK